MKPTKSSEEQSTASKLEENISGQGANHSPDGNIDTVKITRLLKMLTDCNQIMVRAETEQQVMKDICRCIVHQGDYVHAWIGFFDPQDSKKPGTVIEYGQLKPQKKSPLFQVIDYLLKNRDTIRDSFQLQQCFSEQYIPEKHPQKKLRKEADKLGYYSFIALPLMEEAKYSGILAIFSPRPDDFGKEESKTFMDLARDLSSGITSLRTKDKLKKTQKALIESQNMLQLVMDTIPIRLFWKDTNYNYLGCNKPFALDAGLNSPEEIVGKNDFELSWKETAPLYRSDDREIIEKKISKINYEEPQVRVDGTRLWLRTSKSPLRNQEGEIIGLFGSYEDITERKRAEEALWESERRYKMATTAGSVGVWDLKPKTGEMYIDPILKALLGFDDNEMENSWNEWIKHVYPGDLTAFNARTDDYLQGKSPYFDLTYRMVHRDGSIKWFNIRGTVLQDMEGKPYRMVGTQIDVTKQMEAELDKEDMRSQLLQAQKMEAVGTLAGGMAHDFNNLLTTIKGYTDLTVMEMGDTPSLMRNLKQIQKAVSRASNLTNQLLLFSRKHLIEQSSININETITNILALLTRLIGEDIQIATDLSTEIWKIWADEGNIEQVVMNLSVNSRDAMPQGGQIMIRTRNVSLDETKCKRIPESRPGDFVQLTFSDTGTGMTEGVLKHIFEPFFTTKEMGKGTGLGLSVVFGIISQHNGWINVDSKVSKGTTFEIYIPASFAKPVRPPEEKRSLRDYRGKGETILLVEDEEGIREFICQFLSDNGYNVFCASNAEEAGKYFRKARGKVKLILTDVVLPDQSGLDLVEKLRGENPDLAVIVTSGYTGDKTNWSKIQKKGYRFLKKPFAVHELLNAVHTQINLGKY